MGLPPFPLPTWSSLLPSNWPLAFFVCGAVVGVTLVLLKLFFLVPDTIRRVTVNPVIEELTFRLLLLWLLLRLWLAMGLQGAFWWCLVAFVVPHAFDAFATADWGRLLDAFNVGVVTSVVFLLMVLEQSMPVWGAVVTVIVLHAAYNAVIVVAKRLPVLNLLVGIVRRVAVLFAVLVYWYGLGRLAGLWPGKEALT